MRKTGKLPYIFTFMTVLLLNSFSLVAAEDVEVQASLDSEYVEVGGYVNFYIEVITDDALHVEYPAIPQLSGLRFVSSSPSTSTRQRTVDGEPKLVHRFAYQLQGTEEGLVAIPSINVRVDGEEYQSNELDIRVTDSGQPPPDYSRQPEIFLQKELSDEQPVRGQQITADIVIYYRDYINLNNYQVIQGWNTEGFWQEDLNEDHRARAETVFLEGQRYRRAVLMRHAVYPTRAESMTLQPYKIRANVRGRPRHGESELFSSGSGNKDIELQTDPMVLDVRQLPQPERGQYINAVGNFTVERYIEDESVRIGESVGVVTEIKGDGNLGLLGRPEYDIPNGFDSFQPREEMRLDKSDTRITGTKTFRDVLISRRVGTFTIPEAEIAIYNSRTDSYQVHELPELNLEVTRNPDAQIGYRESGEFRLTPERTVSGWTRDDDQLLFGQWWFWVGLALPFFILIGSYNYYRYTHYVAADATLQRKNNAMKVARNLLSEAKEKEANGELKEAYALIYRALLTFITDKLNIYRAGYTVDEITEIVSKYLPDQRRTERLEQILRLCSEVRYTPDAKVESAEEEINKALGLITYMNRFLK